MQDIAVFGAGLLGQSVSEALIAEGYSIDIFESSQERIDELIISSKTRNFYQFNLGTDSFTGLGNNYTEIKNKKYYGVVNCTYPFVNKSKPHDGSNLTDSDTFVRSVSAHLGNSYEFMLLATEILEAGGSAISFASIYGSTIPKFEVYDDTDMTTPPDYVASKAGLIMLSKYFASFYISKGLRFNTISPGGVFDHQNPIFVEKYCDKTLHNQMLVTEDVVGPLVFLLSDGGRMVTGQDLVVDGGFTI
tara:strand:- start:275 stop:1015 length:741 start_codon:yes stop_codon:yes gene_type:complete